MLRIGLIGDTQGRYPVPELLETVKRHFDGVDEIWHAGDWQYEEVLEGLRAIAPLTAVNGNAPDDRRFPDRVRRSIERLEVGMVHRPPHPGDRWVDGLDICIHGHTHRWRDEVIGSTRFINVSTATGAFPSGDRTVAVLALKDGEADLRKIQL